MILTKKDLDKLKNGLDASRDSYLQLSSGDAIPVAKDSALGEGFEAGYIAAIGALNSLLNARHSQNEPPSKR